MVLTFNTHEIHQSGFVFESRSKYWFCVTFCFVYDICKILFNIDGWFEFIRQIWINFKLTLTCKL